MSMIESTTDTPVAPLGMKPTAAPAETAALSGLDKDAFLKLLVAQLRYQNPMSPMDGQEYLAQAAQFAQVERLEGLAKAQAELVAYQKVLISSSLVGKEVRGLDELGNEVEGTVRSVSFAGGAPSLDVDGTKVSLDTVQEVTGVPQAPAASTETPTDSNETSETEATDGTSTSQEEAQP